MPGLWQVDVQRKTDVRFSELADRWGDCAQELEILGTYWTRTDQFDRAPVHVNIMQRDPLVRFAAEVETVTWKDVERFGKVETVTIEGEGFDPRQLDHLQALLRMKRLRLRVAMSDELMHHLAGLHHLQRLDLSGYSVHGSRLDSGACDPLRSLVNLQTFSAAVTGMNDRHLVFLAECPELRRVYLWDLGVAAATLENLRKVPGLEELLCFNSHQFRDEDLELLKDFGSLRSCWIHGGYVNRDLLDSVLDSIPTMEMDPARRKRYRTADVSLSHRALWKLPDL
jgi:hypothetical protein